MTNEQQPTAEQLHRQNQLIQALQQEVGALTGEKIAVTIAYQEAQRELEKVHSDKIAELDKQAENAE